VDRVFDNPLLYSGFENLMAVYGYTIQIYCDFSGYTDIAIGLALLMGFHLPLNFNSPYKALNITDFWRRWHISLSAWLRDYLYISLGGNRHGKVRTYLNLFITMLLGGLWHGAHLRFIIWGALHGVALALHKIWMELFKTKDKPSKSIIIYFITRLITFHFVAFCWIYFRAPSMEIVNQLLSQIWYKFNPALIVEISIGYAKIFSVIGLGYLLHFIPTAWKEKCSTLFGGFPIFIQAPIIVLIVLLLYQVSSSGIQPFIYFQF
jgi:D-alanyl-lipoteichoic acid acyltransferase DltB (MBOAT superfamily)